MRRLRLHIRKDQPRRAQISDARRHQRDTLARLHQGQNTRPCSRTVDQVGRESGPRTHTDNQVEECRISEPLGHHKPLAGQVCHTDRTRCQRVVARHGNYDGIVQQHFGAQDSVVWHFERTGETQIDLSRLERLHLLIGQHLDQRQLHLRMRPAELANDRREKSAGPPMEEADRQRTHLPEHGAARQIDGAIGRGKCLASLAEEDHALWRQPCRPLPAIDQRTADFVLQIGDLLADRGLRDMQSTAGLAKSSVLSHGGKVS